MTTNDSTTHTSQPPVARLAMVTLDCADPGPVSDFWTAVLGWDKAYGDESYAILTGPTHALGFGRVEGYEPSWARRCPTCSRATTRRGPGGCCATRRDTRSA